MQEFLELDIDSKITELTFDKFIAEYLPARLKENPRWASRFEKPLSFIQQNIEMVHKVYDITEDTSLKEALNNMTIISNIIMHFKL